VIDWTLVRFEALSGRDVHDLLQLRSAVFVLEQSCVYQDIDGQDVLPGTRHLIARQDGELVACARSMAPAGTDAEARIGRVAVVVSHRRRGIARQVLMRLVDDLDGRLGDVPQRLDAQLEAVPLYESAGFARFGEPFLEDGIAHVGMRRDPSRQDNRADPARLASRD